MANLFENFGTCENAKSVLKDQCAIGIVNGRNAVHRKEKNSTPFYEMRKTENKIIRSMRLV